MKRNLVINHLENPEKNVLHYHIKYLNSSSERSTLQTHVITPLATGKLTGVHTLWTRWASLSCLCVLLVHTSDKEQVTPISNSHLQQDVNILMQQIKFHYERN